MGKLKHIILISAFNLFLIYPFSSTLADDTPSDPTNIELSEENDAPYSAGEFDALSDAEKREVYFNFPQLLPLDFKPENYPGINDESTN